jgi:putative FmdB family regulatory protein
MPVYEYYCEQCESVFEALRPLRESDRPAACPSCGREAERIMPTAFATMAVKEGWAQRVPFHHRPVRAGEPKKPIAPVKPGSVGRRIRRAGRDKEG